jgi:hypothetical protein
LVGLYWQGKEKVFAIDPVDIPVDTFVVGPEAVGPEAVGPEAVGPEAVDPVVVAAVEAVKTVGAL